jgi:hypothetical protein
MGKRKPERQVILPPDLDDDDEAQPGGGIPDDDGWIHLEGADNGTIRRDVSEKERKQPVARGNAARRRK